MPQLERIEPSREGRVGGRQPANDQHRRQRSGHRDQGGRARRPLRDPVYQVEVLLVARGRGTPRREARSAPGGAGHEDRACDHEPAVVGEDLQPRVAAPERPLVDAPECVRLGGLGHGGDERAVGRLGVEGEPLHPADTRGRQLAGQLRRAGSRAEDADARRHECVDRCGRGRRSRQRCRIGARRRRVTVDVRGRSVDEQPVLGQQRERVLDGRRHRGPERDDELVRRPRAVEERQQPRQERGDGGAIQRHERAGVLDQHASLVVHEAAPGCDRRMCRDAGAE